MGGYAAVVLSPLPGECRLGIVTTSQGLVAIDFLPSATPLRAADDQLSRTVVAALDAYFAGAGDPFRQLPLAVVGSAYQRRIWCLLQTIMPGETRTYGELATVAGSGARAVAGACRANPIPIVVPCHRVVARSGLGGYGGATSGENLRIKAWLLAHEAE